MEGALSGSQYNRAWRIHHAISEALERLLFKRLKNEVASQMSDDVFHIACEDEDSITEDKIKILSELATEYQNYKTSVRGITLRVYSYH